MESKVNRIVSRYNDNGEDNVIMYSRRKKKVECNCRDLEREKIETFAVSRSSTFVS